MWMGRPHGGPPSVLAGGGGSVDFLLPHRIKEGYGLSLEAMKRIQASGTSFSSPRIAGSAIAQRSNTLGSTAWTSS